MLRITSTSLIAATICLALTADSANAQFKFKGKIGSVSKNVRTRISTPSKSLPKTKLRNPLPVKRIGNMKPKQPVAKPNPRPITLPKNGIRFPKPSLKLPKTNPIHFPKPRIDLPKPGHTLLPKPVIRFPKRHPRVLPNPGPGTVVGPKLGTGPIVPPNPGITPLPNPIKKPDHNGCWKPPRRCDWWVNICRPIQTCRPVDVVHCDWNHVHCESVLPGQIIVKSRWYLGVEGVFLPGKGLGIESVAEGSPAAKVGVTAGMVIIQANGIDMVTEEAMQQAIASSQGTLSVVILSEASEVPLEGTIQMVRLTTAKF